MTPESDARPNRGSSPLTRGKPRAASGRGLRLGLIPAHAGKTRARCAAGSKRRAHPRSRGENCELVLQESNLYGSSPLTRGKPLNCASGGAYSGLIPAHAGKTRVCLRRRRSCRAHPRSRGENLLIAHLLLLLRGSSPLTRGKPAADSVPSTRVGLIPAHAGKTGPPARPRGQRRAHPRSRGENRLWNFSHAFARGSSPLTRGKRRLRRP